MSLRACPKCQHRFFQIMDDSVNRKEPLEHFVMCSSCGALLGTFNEAETGNK